MANHNESKQSTPAVLWLIFLAVLGILAVLLIWLFRRKQKTEPREPLIVDFANVGVTATVPDQGRRVVVVERDLPPTIPASDQDDFRPERLLVNFEVLEADRPNMPVTEFNPPLKVQVTYTQTQVEAARKDEQREFKAPVPGMPILGFWDGSRWISFKPVKHKLTYTPNYPPESGGGVATVELERWADPPLGWYPP
jgi:hypothetical protein